MDVILWPVLAPRLDGQASQIPTPARLRGRRIAAKAGVPLVEGYLGHITCYLTPVEISAAKAAETQ